MMRFSARTIAGVLSLCLAINVQTCHSAPYSSRHPLFFSEQALALGSTHSHGTAKVQQSVVEGNVALESVGRNSSRQRSRWFRWTRIGVGALTTMMLIAQLRSHGIKNGTSRSYDYRDELSYQESLKRMELYKDVRKIQRQQIRFKFANDGQPRVSIETARQVAELILSIEEKLGRDSELSPAQLELIRRHRLHFDGFAKAMGRIMDRNPWSIVAQNTEGRIVGVVLCALVEAQGDDDIPDKAVETTRLHQRHLKEDKHRNTIVDFWYTGETGVLAKATLNASFELARMIRLHPDSHTTIDDDHVYAYSNPRGLWKWEPWHATSYSYADLVLGTAYNATYLVHDLAITGHADLGALLARKIKNAFGKILGESGIGSGWCYLMRYPFRLAATPSRPIPQMALAAKAAA